jgi:hypothetical protein
VGGGDVAHGGLLGDAEQAHQPERVGGFGGFVEFTDRRSSDSGSDLR